VGQHPPETVAIKYRVMHYGRLGAYCTFT